MRKALSFIGGFMAGLVTGGVLALLFTPKSGENLKQEVQEYVEHLINEGKDAAEARRLELEEQLEAFKQGRPIKLSPLEAE